MDHLANPFPLTVHEVYGCPNSQPYVSTKNYICNIGNEMSYSIFIFLNTYIYSKILSNLFS